MGLTPSGGFAATSLEEGGSIKPWLTAKGQWPIFSRRPMADGQKLNANCQFFKPKAQKLTAKKGSVAKP
ncbi:hypothetical protein B0537_09010 [Desulforamulus ferrireducens]|uniref:Uncharacterized protein n=1 Tax=Desulforamulus ferrireducens TaxID=1833852 RepID=A0A1S6IWQ3_9FIRM|nr:hypothetical protein B0537_09010 [Desulforamulus ferrireducens]